MRIAAIDLGSNTVKLTIADTNRTHAASGADRYDERTEEILLVEECAAVTRIGQRLDATGHLEPAAIERTLVALRQFADRARALGVEKIGCVGTAGLRGASNAPSFLARVERETGIRIEIIDGLREAALSFQAAVAAYGPGALLVLDVGGRSTELILGSGAGIEARVSMEIGSVRLTERYVRSDPPRIEELDEARRAIGTALEQAPSWTRSAVAPPRPTLIGVSGTVMSVMGVALGLDDMREAVSQGEGRLLALATIQEVFDDLRQKTTPERVRGTVIPEGRADVIVCGVLIMLEVLAHYGLDAMRASNRGVRYGLLRELASS
ncbi:MAG: Ppx/GppA family phosphatase [Deltaproteobacteria bacterium]|nr:Ppx/GppA family phosphatase [Deltaproteobacteria bacterium]